MIVELAREILETVAPPWYSEGTPLEAEYATFLENHGLIAKMSDGKYKRTKEGHCFLKHGVVTIPLSFSDKPSDLLEKYFRF